MMSEHPELPDLIRKTGVPVPQVLDRSGETLAWKPAEDMAPKLDDLIEALGARATEQTLAQIKTALTDGSLKAQLSGKKVQVDVVGNACSLAPGAAKIWSLGMTTEDDMYVAIECDTDRWRATTDAPWTTSHITDGLYPRRDSETATSVGYSKVSRVILPGGYPANGTEASNLAVGAWNKPGQVRVVNQHETDTATVTIKAVRIWR